MGVIFLVAGHHLKDPGASGNGYQENKLTIEMRDLIATRIRQLSPGTILWVDEDRDTLSQVIAKVNAVATVDDYLLDVHFDAAASPKASGATAFVADGARDKSKTFGKDNVDMVSTILRIPNRGVRSEKLSNRKRLGILHTKASSALLEVGFISNPTDMVNHEDWKHWAADEIARICIARVG